MITAWQALVERGELEAGQRVLIHGGAGGVGHVALQIARCIGAEVATTVSTDDKAQLARACGADHVIRYREEAVADYVARLTGGEGFDLVFDSSIFGSVLFADTSTDLLPAVKAKLGIE